MSTDESASDAVLPGVIDTLGLGYASLASRPLIVVPFIVLELATLFSPRILMKPITTPVAEMAEERGAGWGVLGSTAQRLSDTSMFEFVSLQFPFIRTPVFVPSLGQERLATFPWSLTFSSLPAAILALVAVLALVIGVFVSVMIRLLLSAGVARDGSARDAIDLHVVGVMALRFTGWILALLGLFALIAMPVLIVTAIGAVVGFGGSQLLWLVMLLPVAWGFVHFYFSIHALFVDRVGPFRALRSSYLVVRRYFWPSLQFIATAMLIMTGLSFALRQLASSTGGVLVAATLNSFVAAGIIVATMLFYRDRARRLGLPDYLSGK